MRWQRRVGYSFVLTMGVVAAAYVLSKESLKQSQSDPLKQKYPYSILTPHYGILTEWDLAQDAHTYILGPYNEGKLTGGAFWSCFPITSVKAEYNSWRDADPMGPSNVITTLCSLGIEAKTGFELDSYYDRRGHSIDFCKDFTKHWKKLTMGESFVCLNGEHFDVAEDVINGRKYKVRSWTWNKFKTKKGCYSYFASGCPSHAG